MLKPLFFLTILICFGCKKENAVDYAILSGKIINLEANHLTLGSRERIFEEIIPVREDGSFNDTIKLDLGFYLLNDGINTTYLSLEPGDNINLTYYKNDHKNSLKINGKGAEKSQYLSAKNKILSTQVNTNLKSLLMLDEKDFKNKFDNIKSTLLDTLSSTLGLSNEFRVLEARNINYEILSRYTTYKRSHARMIKDPSFVVSDSFFNEMGKINFNSEKDFVFSSKYQFLTKSHFRKISMALAKRDSIPHYLAWIQTIQTIPSELIRNKLLFDNAVNEIVYADNVEKFYNAHIGATTDEIVKSKITTIYNKLNSLNPGHLSPTFINYENYNGGTTSLDDFKGKHVYIDVWATWCAPCITEIPYQKKIERKYSDKNIAFVSISVDINRNREKWKMTIDKNQLGGTQLIADQAMNSDFIKQYLINGIPRYILIDPQGKIINSDAPRPSDPNLEELFDALKI